MSAKLAISRLAYVAISAGPGPWRGRSEPRSSLWESLPEVSFE